MKKPILFLTLITFCFLAPVESLAKRKKVFKRKWAFSITNAYTFDSLKKTTSANDPFKWEDLEGQMQSFFSALEISRNMGSYEVGAKIQHKGIAFVSPFFKWNINKNNSRSSVVPAITLGVVPSHIMGGWLRLELAVSLNRYVSLAPFIGSYAWYEIKDSPQYEKYDAHFNVGLKISLYR